MSNFNKILLGKNIKYLTAQRGIKVGDLESQVEVSAGYFSRLSNDDGKNSSTLVDTICKVAEKLGTSVNTLISTDLSALTPNEALLSRFFDKLGKDTSDSTLIWDLESKSILEDLGFQNNHPFFYPKDKNRSSFYYHSDFDANVKIAGDAYRVNVNGKILYLFKVECEGKTNAGYELYFYAGNGYQYVIDPLCRAYPESDLFNQIEDLYNAAAESSRHVKLSNAAMDTIGEYLNPFPF